MRERDRVYKQNMPLKALFDFWFCLQITVTESVLFLLQYVSEDLDNREKIIVMGDCCYLNPLVRRTFRFLGTS